MDFSKKIIVPDEVLFQNVENEGVILDMNTEIYFGLNESGSEFWSILQGGKSIAEACEELLQIYDVEKDALYLAMENLIKELLEKKLIELA